MDLDTIPAYKDFTLEEDRRRWSYAMAVQTYDKSGHAFRKVVDGEDTTAPEKILEIAKGIEKYISGESDKKLPNPVLRHYAHDVTDESGWLTITHNLNAKDIRIEALDKHFNQQYPLPPFSVQDENNVAVLVHEQVVRIHIYG